MYVSQAFPFITSCTEYNTTRRNSFNFMFTEMRCGLGQLSPYESRNSMHTHTHTYIYYIKHYNCDIRTTIVYNCLFQTIPVNTLYFQMYK